MKSSRVGLLLFLLAFPCFSQSRLPDFDSSLNFSRRSEFTFARMIYTSYGWRESWMTDYDKADHQFIAGLNGWVKSLLSINQQPIAINTYTQVLGKEAEIIGSNDHLLQELPLLVDMARRKILDTSRVVSQVIPLNADKINQRLDDLENFTNDVRAVIVP